MVGQGSSWPQMNTMIILALTIVLCILQQHYTGSPPSPALFFAVLFWVQGIWGIAYCLWEILKVFWCVLGAFREGPGSIKKLLGKFLSQCAQTVGLGFRRNETILRKQSTGAGKRPKVRKPRVLSPTLDSPLAEPPGDTLNMVSRGVFFRKLFEKIFFDSEVELFGTCQSSNFGPSEKYESDLEASWESNSEISLQSGSEASLHSDFGNYLQTGSEFMPSSSALFSPQSGQILTIERSDFRMGVESVLESSRFCFALASQSSELNSDFQRTTENHFEESVLSNLQSPESNQIRGPPPQPGHSPQQPAPVYGGAVQTAQAAGEVSSETNGGEPAEDQYQVQVEEEWQWEDYSHNEYDGEDEDYTDHQRGEQDQDYHEELYSSSQTVPSDFFNENLGGDSLRLQDDINDFTALSLFSAVGARGGGANECVGIWAAGK